ncbi:DEAD-domain-containing protein [Punctularia strigosozonata HHB-11173 SS5]|uniref:DEAD-domain-containing protein n=1 Tax=Punctularia strigosozonata (strain HHB-11173) TaxID=741275 RepID=UPI0004417487|nr:DEAD-domain-containing protein [Punctularia strigosozonata HHB-11173 SS5]EIN08368.1 DEAD-domain-containing protein [Punctularia strigosozonata HHB-11173 SS5]
MALTNKRKIAKDARALGPRKRVKSTDDLPWKSISRSRRAALGSGDLDGILDLEEVKGVEVVYEETDVGRVARFNVPEGAEADADAEDVTNDGEQEDAAGSSRSASPRLSEARAEEEGDDFDSEKLLPAWHKYKDHVHPKLLRALHAQGFNSPTPIQAQVIPEAGTGRDVVGIAETGSGKTLAYGLPVLTDLLTRSRPKPKSRRAVQALILAPTRELALQVTQHLNACLNNLYDTPEGEGHDGSKTTNGKGKAKVTTEQKKGPPIVSIAAVIGGMSAQKQRRVLDRGVDVLVATPGRLWDVLQEDDALANQLRHLRFLVLDEADRMVEAGHYAELDNILRLTFRGSGDADTSPEFTGEQAVAAEVEAEEQDARSQHDGLQTFVFSATMSKDLQRNLKQRRKSKKPFKPKTKPQTTLDDLLLRLDFRDPEPKIVDLSPEGGIVSTLKQSKVECLSADKDVYLYYFLLRYPGRSLVFLSAIDGIRRLMPLLDLLGVKAFPLHSQLEQRQRLKNLDRFKSTANSVLLATDIAARGLDIPSVDHVIHYQIPRSADVYVHRNGRTARAMRDGFSLLMCAPDERKVVRALLGSVGREEDEIPEIAVELHILYKLKERVQLAKQIDSQQHKVRKVNHEKKWMREAAEAMEIELNSDFASDNDDLPAVRKRKEQDAKIAKLKAELKQMLAQPLVAQGVSKRYITSGTRPIADELLAGEYHETMLGLPKSVAGSDVQPVKKRKQKAKKLASGDDGEEWGGINAE